MTHPNWPDLAPPQLGARIPKIIHQTYGTADLPPALAANVAALKAMNPGWDYRFYDDDAIEAFLRAEYGPDMLALYQRIDPRYGAARADLFRYLLIYRQGGVYLDIKSRFTRPIDEVIQGDESYIIAQWSNGPGEKYEGFGLKPELTSVAGGEFQQWHVIAAPGHPFLHAVLQAIFSAIDDYRPWLHGTGKAGVIKLTGPIIYTLAIALILRQHPCKIVRTEAELALEYSVVPGDTHRTLFKAHYTKSEASVVQLPPHLRPVNLAYHTARSLKRRLTAR